MEKFEQMHGLVCELMENGCGQNGFPDEKGMRIVQELAEYCMKTGAWHTVRKHLRKIYARNSWRELFAAYKDEAWRVKDKMELGKLTCMVFPLIWEKMQEEKKEAKAHEAEQEPEAEG